MRTGNLTHVPCCPTLLLTFTDMVRMGDVNEATVLHNLRMRFAEDLIYTNIGEGS